MSASRLPVSRLFGAASLAIAALLCLAGVSPVRAAGPLDAYLPKSGKIEGHVMKLGVPPEDQAIDKQFRLAVQNNMDWFKKYVQGQKPGQPIPYDRRMGITEAQYEKLQHMKADFQAGAPFTLDVKRGADGAISFAPKSDSATAFGKVTFGPNEKAAETPYGKLSIFSPIEEKNESAPLGIWQGAEWARVAQEDDEMPSAKIAFGKRTPSGEGVLYYQVAPHKDQREQSIVVFYKLD